MKNSIYAIAVATAVLLSSCGDEAQEKTTETPPTPPPPAIEMTDVGTSPAYDDATLGLKDVKSEVSGDSVKLTFNFNVANYELKSQTADAENKMCNNSAQGQHIHFIMDNSPYAALYEPTHTVTLAKNSEHYLMAFLSRSYHESVKTKGAALVHHFKIDENGKVLKMDAPNTPMLFYSRPKGDYVGAKNTENLLFDFYVWNTVLGDDSNQVLAHIKGDGVDTTMVVKDWKASFLRHMPMGKSSIHLTLADKSGTKKEGPMTEVTREFTLSAEEPVAK